MTVGTSGSNLVVLHEMHGFDLQYDHTKLRVVDVNSKSFADVLNPLYKQFVLWGVVNEDDAKNYLAAAHNCATLTHLRLLLVTAQHRGLTRIKATNGRFNLSIDVGVVNPQSFTIAFKFFRITDADGNTNNTKWDPSDAPALTRKLSCIYGLQANISFELVGADLIQLKPPSQELMFLQPNPYKSSELQPVAVQATWLLPRIPVWQHPKADVTMCVFQTFQSQDKIGNGETFCRSGFPVCAVSDTVPPGYVPPDEDPFVVLLAHELGHFLQNQQNPTAPGVGHHKRQWILLCDEKESVQIDRTLLNTINSYV
jgi:hypothetical protein